MRRTFLDDYAEAADSATLEQYDANRRCYELLALTRAMEHPGMSMANGDAEDRDAAAAAYRKLFDEYC